MSKTQVIRKGEIVVVTEGEYSEYGMLAACKALRDFNVSPTLEEFMKDHGRPSEVVGERYYSVNELLSWLVKHDFLEEIRAQELWLLGTVKWTEARSIGDCPC